MAEAIISRRGFKTGGSSSANKITQVFTSNQTFYAPKAINNSFEVRVFGGGGGCSLMYQNTRPGSNNSGTTRINGYSASGGGGGWMNNGIVSLSEGQAVIITIGDGGKSQINNFQGITGGTTSFGGYLSANGGSGAYRHTDGTGIYTYEEMFGGEGGSGGGCCFNNGKITSGGDGYQFGGGGTGPDRGNKGGWDGISHKAGNGGIWGGGGGFAVWLSILNAGLSTQSTDTQMYITMPNDFSYYLDHSIGGIYGGNGGVSFDQNSFNNVNYNGRNGTNTIGLLNNSELEGEGLGSKGSINSNRGFYFGATGAGGGYGGCGGIGGSSTGRWNYHHYLADQKTNYFYILPGGGGGYGANGGNGNSSVFAGGGGGGYIGKGGDGWGSNSWSNFRSFGGGGGGYGKGADKSAAGFGGGGSVYQPGGSGICIVQYYSDI